MNKTANFRKRKTKNRPKNNGWKRTKFPRKGMFEESTFDSSDEDDTISPIERPSKGTNSFICEFNKVLNITPSKSETDSVNVTVGEERDFECDISSLFNEKYDVSDNDNSFVCDSVVAELICEKDKGAHVVSIDMKCDNHGISSERNGSGNEDENNSVIEAPSNETDQANWDLYDNLDITLSSSSDSESINPTVDEEKDLEDISFSPSTVHCHYTSDGIILILNENDTVHFHGLSCLTVLHGKIEILGHILNKDNPEIKVYSFRGSSLLYIKNVTEIDTPATNYLLGLNVSDLKITKKCAIILCKKLQDKSVSFIEKHVSQQILPNSERDFPRLVFEPKVGSWNYLKTDPQWNEIIEKISTKTKLMICGGKGVGKTTFLRYAINKLLLKFPVIRVIDLDPGQSEFTIPGCISIIHVKEPIFGANYTHLQNTERSIISNINIAYEPDRYILGVKELVNSNLEKIPTLINYMGYTHGMGFNILSAVIICVKPTDVLQVHSQDSKKNFKHSLSPFVVRENARIFIEDCPSVNYKLQQINSMCDENDSWMAEPRLLREMCILSYLSRMIEDNSIYKCTAPIYKINLKDINLSNLNGETIVAAAINASLVALCKSVNEKNIFECFGWGIVRGIDLNTNELVLQTIEKLEILDKTTHLVSGGATLPPSLYMTSDEIAGAIPYVMEGQLLSFGLITKRSRQSVKKDNLKLAPNSTSNMT